MRCTYCTVCVTEQSGAQLHPHSIVGVLYVLYHADVMATMLGVEVYVVLPEIKGNCLSKLQRLYFTYKANFLGKQHCKV